MVQSEEIQDQEQKENESDFKIVGFSCHKDIVEIVRTSLPGINLSNLLRSFMEDVAKQLKHVGPFELYKIKFITKEDAHAVQKRLLSIPEI